MSEVSWHILHYSKCVTVNQLNNASNGPIHVLRLITVKLIPCFRPQKLPSKRDFHGLCFCNGMLASNSTIKTDLLTASQSSIRALSTTFVCYTVVLPDKGFSRRWCVFFTALPLLKRLKRANFLRGSAVATTSAFFNSDACAMATWHGVTQDNTDGKVMSTVLHIDIPDPFYVKNTVDALIL